MICCECYVAYKAKKSRFINFNLIFCSKSCSKLSDNIHALTHHLFFKLS